MMPVGGVLPIVAVTGFGQEQDKDKAAQAGFTAHVTKPADPATIADLLRACSADGDGRNLVNGGLVSPSGWARFPC